VIALHHNGANSLSDPAKKALNVLEQRPQISAHFVANHHFLISSYPHRALPQELSALKLDFMALLGQGDTNASNGARSQSASDTGNKIEEGTGYPVLNYLPLSARRVMQVLSFRGS
jgi:hypothetical protein